MNMQGIYIYGFVENDCIADIKNILLESGIYSIEYNEISAVVTDTKINKLEYLNKEELAHLLVDHQLKIEKIMNSGCSKVIPMQLGTVVSSGNDVMKILINGYNILKETFEIIDEVEEIDIVAVWSNFLDVIKDISDSPQIKLMKENINKKSLYDQNDSISIGKAIKEKIDQKNSKACIDIVNSLMPFCLDARKHESMNDEMPLNYAFLVKKEESGTFIEMIDQLDIKYADKINFKIVGPLPCYSFYTIESKAIKKEDIENAKKILGIDLSDDNYNLKKAYRSKASITHPDKNSENVSDSSENFIESNNAYKLLIDYSSILKQSPDNLSNEPFYVVKIKN